MRFARRLGSFRARVLLLACVVAVAAAGVTAWVTVWQATHQVAESADVQRETSSKIVRVLTSYGELHGTWEGVSNVVADLSQRTGERIRLTTTYGQVIVDSDTLHDITARAVPVQDEQFVQSQPALDNKGQWRSREPAIVLGQIDRYRTNLRDAACLTRQGIPLHTGPSVYGLSDSVPVVVNPGDQPVVDACAKHSRSSDSEVAGDKTALDGCLTFSTKVSPSDLTPSPSMTNRSADCAQSTFQSRIQQLLPEPLRLALGAGSGTRGAIAIRPAPVLAAAVLVVLLVLAGTVLLSRRVLRPIGALAAASRDLSAGDLAKRVPVRGHDELADLSTEFNRMAESLQRSEEQQRRMTADIAHELRTPLSNIRGYVEALKDGVLEPNTELFTSLYEEALLQQRLLDDLQDLALAESGGMLYHPDRVDVVDVLAATTVAHTAAADARGIHLVVDDRGAPIVRADAGRLRQVVSILVSNAVRATPDGGTVTLRASGDSGYAVIEVADTGHGIAPRDLPHVFDRFWRADGSRRRSTGGSGLGLAIAREIVTAHAGTISVASEPGTGSVFTVRLPAIGL